MNKETQSTRLHDLRLEMKARGLSAYLVPRADQHQNEYVPPSAERLNWISGFSGTAGLAVIGLNTAAMFVDGRYTLQVKDQCAAEFWQYQHVTNNPVELWLQRVLTSGDKVGFDATLHTPSGLARLRTVMDNAGVSLVSVEQNLIDVLWQDRPEEPTGAIDIYPEKYAGESSASKRHRIASVLREGGADALVISCPDDLSWLFNIRGHDLAMTPVVLGYAILKSDGSSTLFVNGQKLGGRVREHLQNDGISISEPEEFVTALKAFKGQSVRVDRLTASLYICDILKNAGATIEIEQDPCRIAKAVKNAVELQGMQNAHIRDGVALVRFFNWFKNHPPKGQTEWTVAQKLAAFRERGDLYKSSSFQTISAVGANGAIVHYGLNEKTAAPLQDDQLYLVDSGGQYLDGTTDVTRVLAIGTPTPEMILRYTQVLKGHIAVSAARFPLGTTGAQIDPLARQFLWADGVDYDHGTGHGVGCYLSVHEGPQSISKHNTEVCLRPGMILSIEPGFYKAGAFGIRIENLAMVKEFACPEQGQDSVTLGFEPLTLAPFERALIDVEKLSEAECDWIDAYHARVRQTLTPLLDKEDVEFLAQQTAHIKPRSL